MIRREEGFTLVELIITMFIFVLILAATSNTFVDLLKDFKKQSSQAETNIEGAVGLDILRRDIEHAGYGLPWRVAGAAWTLEAVSDPQGADEPPDPFTFNDVPSAPRALVSGNNTGVNFSAVTGVGIGSDYLVIKAVNVGINEACQKWTYVSIGNVVKAWIPAGVNSDNLKTSDRVIVISPGSTDTDSRALVVAGTTFTTRYLAGALNNANFAPSDASEVRIVYGVTPSVTPVETDLRMPFNRADYFIERPATGISSTCAPNTGVLYKAVVEHTGGGLNKIPILDCVADMQVAFRRDSDDDGDIDVGYDGNISALTSSEIRQIKEVRVYILAHEGQKDMSYTSPATIRVGDIAMQVTDTTSMLVGRDLNIIGTNVNYRWKLYVLVVKTENLK